MNENATIKLIDVEDPSHIQNGFEDVIGQSKVLQKLSFYIQSHSKETPCPTFLFSGSHGLGKTYVSERVAKSLGRRYIEINCANVRKSSELFEDVFLNQVLGTTPVTILLDESHKLSSEVSNVLLSILNPNSSHKNHVLYEGVTYEFDLTLINFIFATTDAYLMFAPLKNRAENIYFERYGSCELIKMLRMYLGKDIEFECDLEDLASACRNRGRDTFLLSTKLKRFLNFKKEGRKVLTQDDWNSFKDIFEIYPLGLSDQEVDLLKNIAEHEPISASNLALKMMVNERNITEEMEIRLRELGLIESTSRGRILSENGKKYIKELK